MTKTGTNVLAWVLGAVLCQGCASTPAAATPTRTGSETNMTKHVKGIFNAKATPLAPDAGAAQSPIGRLSIDKRYHGALEGTGVGQMLATLDDGQSGGYVALERVTGTLEGRKGSFTLMHSGSMTRGAFKVVGSVVPESGTDELQGISGTYEIQIDEKGVHLYVLDYTLASQP
ncbi:DUF3224 domain-containing protein [Myxococcus fulvus]|uniref:DUF3224 domain-containing protein n=1 Tax=Myxococcus fulvus TaxID=33 RepID=UPI0020BEFAC1|nr:DUF3224 domain-containing protein [Myxococcus fulvus]MCK8500025.1 DUF3224 domain-containing protein [Myxococcus fulvus]